MSREGDNECIMVGVTLAPCVRVGLFMRWDWPPDQYVIYPATVAGVGAIAVLFDFKEGVWPILP